MGRTTLFKAAFAVSAWAAMAAPAQAAIVGSTPSPSWQANGRVTTITVSGTTAYIGGKFTSLRPAGAPAGTGEVTRNHAAAINLTTGALLPWNPNVNGLVSAIYVNGNNMYLGGGFGTVGGVSRKKAAAVNASTGALNTAFRISGLNGEVRTIDLSNGHLYLGGAFTAPRNYSATFDPASGGFQSAWAPVTDGPVDAILTTNDGSNHVVVGGAFNTLNGVSSNAIGAVDPSTGASVTWNWHGPTRGSLPPVRRRRALELRRLHVRSGHRERRLVHEVQPADGRSRLDRGRDRQRRERRRHRRHRLRGRPLRGLLRGDPGQQLLHPGRDAKPPDGRRRRHRSAPVVAPGGQQQPRRVHDRRRPGHARGGRRLHSAGRTVAQQMFGIFKE